MSSSPYFQSEVQISLNDNDGEIQNFIKKSDFMDYFLQNEKLDKIVKVSFGDNENHHRFVKRKVNRNLQQALLNKYNIFFQIGKMIYADIPLNPEKFDQINIFAEEQNMEFYDAYDYICIQNAINANNFLEYIMQTA